MRKDVLPMRRGRPWLGFGVLHSGNTLLNMGFTLLQLLVLARILPLERYSEVVFLISVGFYVQPFDQAIGKANFVALRGEAVATGKPPARPELVATLAAQAGLLLLIAIAVPCALAALGSVHWIEDLLFLFLCLAINFWAFDLQSTAWSIDRNVAFVRLSIAHRLLHLGALLLAWATGSFLAFGLAACAVTLACLAIVARMFARAGLFAVAGAATDWPGYLRILRVSFLSTVTDFLVLNAPYMLLSARFGIGPMLIIFDSVMKVARIAMAGSRTLAEIALPRLSAMMAADRRREGRLLFLLVVAVSLGATLVPALAILLAGSTVFHLLLKANDVLPGAAMAPAALIVLAGGLYQPAVFFLGYRGDRRPVQALILGAGGVFAAFAAALYALALNPVAVLSLFAAGLLGLGVLAAILTLRLFSGPAPVSAKVAPSLADPAASVA